MEFPVSSAMDDVDGQVHEDENGYVFVGAVHGVFMRSSSADGGKLDGTAALTTSRSRGTIRQNAVIPNLSSLARSALLVEELSLKEGATQFKCLVQPPPCVIREI